MTSLLAKLTKYLPGRRRRHWRYVSGQRRRFGLAIFAVLVVLLYSGWWLTNDTRIKRRAEAYLREVTGQKVSIRHASFGFHDGIKLEGVRITAVQAGREEELFEAEEVWLRHEPMSLLRGRLEVREIICIKPVPTIIRRRGSPDVATRPKAVVVSGGWDPRDLLKRLQSGGGGSRRLPVICLRDGGVRYKEIGGAVGGKGQEIVAVETDPIDVTAVPMANGAGYEIAVRWPGRDPCKGKLDFKDGLTWTARPPLASIMKAVPGIRRELAGYDVAGDVRIDIESGTSAGQRILIHPIGMSMTLPTEEGGLEIVDLTGRLCIANGELQFDYTDDAGVHRPLAGRLPQFGGAKVTVAGTARGDFKAGGVQLTICARDLQFPVALPGRTKLTGLGAVIEQFQREMGAEGKADLTIGISRDAKGKLSVRGRAAPRGMALSPRALPGYRLTDVRGLTGAEAAELLDAEIDHADGDPPITFDEKTVAFHSLSARHGGGRLILNGVVGGLDTAKPTYALRIAARDLPLDDDLRVVSEKAMPGFWKTFLPAGRTSADVAVTDQPGAPHPLVDITFGRRGSTPSALSAVYKYFPYKLDRVSGRIVVENNTVALHSVGGFHGQAPVTVSGRVDGVDRKWPDFELKVAGYDLPLDEDLAAALLAKAREAYDSFSPSGVADVVGSLGKAPGGKFRYELTATLKKDVSLTYDQFPYPLDAVTGVLVILPEHVAVQGMTARLGKGRMTAAGRILLGKGGPDMDLTIEASDVALGKTLRDALSVWPEAAKAWRLLKPVGGVADATVKLTPRPAGVEQIPFDVTVRPKGTAITFQPFPYPVSDVRGTVVIKPGRVTLKDDLRANGPDGGVIKFSGVVETDKASPAFDLAVSATGIPINKRLLGVVPETLQAVMRHVHPGGTCDIQLDRLVLTPRKTAAGAAAPAGKASPSQWRVDGQIDLRDADVDIGFESKKITGAVAGTLECDDNGDALAIDAAVDLAKMSLGGRAVTNVTAELSKAADNPLLRVLKLCGRGYGGRFDGQAEVLFSDPVRYGVELAARDLHLNALLNAGVTDPAKRIKSTGLLAGRLALQGTVGKVGTRRADGAMQITRGKIAHVPLPLGLVNVVFLQLPTGPSFSTGKLHYYVKGNKLVLHNIYLAGGNASIVGNGSLDLDTEKIDLVFVSGSPKIVPGEFRTLWTAALRGLLPTRITGTWRNPRQKTVPLGDLLSILKEMGVPK